MLQCLATFVKISKNNNINLLFNMIDDSDIKIIMDELYGKASFVKKYEKIKKIIDEKEYNLTEIISYIIQYIINNKLVNKSIIKELSKLELKTYNNLENDLIICSLIGTFVILEKKI